LFFPVSLLLAGIGLVVYRSVNLSLQERMREEVELIARALAKPVAYSLERGRSNSLMDALEAAFDFERVYGAYIYDPEGKLIAHAHHDRIEEPATDPNLPGLPLRREGSYQTHYGEAVFSFFVPLDADDGGPLGMLQVTRSGREMRAALARLRRQFILGYSLFIAGFSLFLFILYHFSIHRPVGRLHHAIRRIKPGKRHERVPATGGRELADLGNALNDMLSAIESQQSQLSQKSREEGRLKRQLRNAEQLAALGEIAASIGHEIGTPLATIDGHAQRGTRKSESPETQTVFQSIRAEVARIERFIRELLSFGEGSPPPARRVDFTSVLSEAAQLARKKQGGEIEMSVDRPAFEGEYPVILADPTRIRLVLKNILANALQANPAGPVRCEVTAERRDLVCRIDDSGPGIPAPDRERIFTPFFTRRANGGTGLGLALADRIVHEYGGTLRATESPAGGARLTVRLPLPG